MATSLEILRPTPSPSSTHAISSKSPTAKDLEARSLQIGQILSSRDFSSPNLSRWLVSDFRAEIDLSHTSSHPALIRSREEYVRYFRRASKGMGLEVASVSADVDEEGGVASVWLLLSVTDLPQDAKGRGRGSMKRESVTILWWRRERGVWRCYSQTGMRGVAGYRI